MDKLRLFLSGAGEDFARLYNWGPEGFRGDQAAISLPSNQSLTLFLISVRQYTLSAEGDATVKQEENPGEEFMRFFSVDWSVEAMQRGEGVATINMVNPEFPLEPFVIRLTMGEFRYEHATPPTDGKATPLSAADMLGAQAMMSHEARHSMLGNLIPTRFWDDLGTLG